MNALTERHRLSAFLFLFILCMPALAQPIGTGLLGKADRYLWNRQRRGALDSLYIAVPEEKWTFKAFADLATTHLHIDASLDGTPASAVLETPPQVLNGISVSYRGLTASISYNLARKRSDALSLSLNSFGNRLCIESNFTKDNPFSGQEGSSHTSLNVDACYFGNGKRFSPPAVFNQSKIQRQNCGSWIAAISYKGHRTDLPKSPAGGIPPMTLTGHTFGIGGGYAYNWVEQKWLLHVSLIPTLAVYDNTKIYSPEGGHRLDHHFANMISTGHFAAFYNHRKFFAGITITVHNCAIGHPDDLLFNYLRLRGSIVIGIRQ